MCLIQQVSSHVAQVIAEDRWTVTSLAAAANVKRDVIYAMMRGQVSACSMRTVMSLVNALGGSVTLTMPDDDRQQAQVPMELHQALSHRNAVRVRRQQERQQQIIALHHQHLTRRQIAQRLHISRGTVSKTLSAADALTGTDHQVIVKRMSNDHLERLVQTSSPMARAAAARLELRRQRCRPERACA